ncbi:hypothetical protein AGMMS49949_05800 [Alphaproteobacteria bacterium]|nr:hypothetical protein AGMMS49949_05800 [Alphaproteobacteria bacterium]GHS97987.1 hypothetical protein AGMMS50296_5380 [Alphaproteobacteria bacterium]
MTKITKKHLLLTCFVMPLVCHSTFGESLVVRAGKTHIGKSEDRRLANSPDFQKKMVGLQKKNSDLLGEIYNTSKVYENLKSTIVRSVETILSARGDRLNDIALRGTFAQARERLGTTSGDTKFRDIFMKVLQRLLNYDPRTRTCGGELVTSSIAKICDEACSRDVAVGSEAEAERFAAILICCSLQHFPSEKNINTMTRFAEKDQKEVDALKKANQRSGIKMIAMNAIETWQLINLVQQIWEKQITKNATEKHTPVKK